MENELQIKITKQPVCKNCGSGQIRFNKDKIICRRCGNKEERK